MQKAKPHIKLAIFVVITIINIFLTAFGEIHYSNAPGNVGFYIAAAFMIVFALWFGMYGVIAAYVGCFIGSGIPKGMPLTLNLYWSLADVWQVLIPLIAFRSLKADITLNAKKDVTTFLVFGWLINNLVGAAWGSSTMAIGGFVSWDVAKDIFIGWMISNITVTIVITPLLLKFVTPLIKKWGIYIEKYW